MSGGGPSSEPSPEPSAPGAAADGAQPDEPDGPAARTELSEQQRRRIAEVFGDVLPATTSDERDDRENTPDQDADVRFLVDRPPHHDRER
jgi:hypothetical protein